MTEYMHVVQLFDMQKFLFNAISVETFSEIMIKS